MVWTWKYFTCTYKAGYYRSSNSFNIQYFIKKILFDHLLHTKHCLDSEDIVVSKSGKYTALYSQRYSLSYQISNYLPNVVRFNPLGHASYQTCL